MRNVQVMLAASDSFEGPGVIRAGMLGCWNRYVSKLGLGRFTIQFVFPAMGDRAVNGGPVALKLIASIDQTKTPLAYEAFLPCMGVDIPLTAESLDVDYHGRRPSTARLWFAEAIEEAPHTERVLLFSDGHDNWIADLEDSARSAGLAVDKYTSRSWTPGVPYVHYNV